MSKIDELVALWEGYLATPLPPGIAPIQRVVFGVYDKTDELRLRLQVEAFETVTRKMAHNWIHVDLTDAFPKWMMANEYREAYFTSPNDLAGYPTGELDDFVKHLVHHVANVLEENQGPADVVALSGVGALFGLARVSTIVEQVKHAVRGRLLVLFPGEYRVSDNSYRLLDARDGWNYLAQPLVVRN